MSTLRNLDLNLLKIFDAIHRSGSVSGAARNLGMSQPSVSRGLSRLRDHFDDPLFERSGNGVVPTAKASAMLESVKGALSLIVNTIDDDEAFDPATKARHFRLFLFGDFIESKVISHLIRDLPPGSPVTFETVNFTGVESVAMLVEDAVDVAVVPYIPQASDVSYRKIFSDSAALIARKGHPALENGFTLDMFAKVSFAGLPASLYRMTRMDELLKTRGLERRVAYTTPKMTAIPGIVAATDLVAFTPLSLAQFAAQTFDLDIFPMPQLAGSQQDIYIAYRKSMDNDPAISWLCERISSVYVAGEAT